MIVPGASRGWFRKGDDVHCQLTGESDIGRDCGISPAGFVDGVSHLGEQAGLFEGMLIGWARLHETQLLGGPTVSTRPPLQRRSTEILGLGKATAVRRGAARASRRLESLHRPQAHPTEGIEPTSNTTPPPTKWWSGIDRSVWDDRRPGSGDAQCSQSAG